MEYGTRMPSSPTRLSSSPVRTYNNSPRIEEEPLQLFAAAMINGGMVTQYDPVDIQPEQLTRATDCYVRDTVTSRRWGNALISVAKPDSYKVLGFYDYKDPEGVVSLYRISTGSINSLGSSSWTPITGAALSTGSNAHIQWITAGTFVGFGNGVDEFQQINVSSNTYAQAGNAPSYKYWCTIANRLVGFNLYNSTTPVPIQLGWSGYLNFDEFSPLVDPSSGYLALETSPSNFSDFGTGIFAFGDSLLAVRERSLWIGTVQPSATDPFYFYNKVPTMGCDTPKSIQQIPSGICYYDKRLKNVFVYMLGAEKPEPIGNGVRDAMRNMITDPALVTSAYDYANDEYILVIPLASSTTVRRWRYNFKSKAWSYDNVFDLSSMSALNYSIASTEIDDLIGTIDSLVGSIADLSPVTEHASVFCGYTDGDLTLEDPDSDDDRGNFFEMDLRSKLFQLDSANTNVSQLHITYKPTNVVASTFFYLDGSADLDGSYALDGIREQTEGATGNFNIWYSKDNGENFIFYRNVVFTIDDIDKRLTAVCNKHIRSRSFMWRLTQTSGSCDIVEFKTYIFPVAGYQRQRTT